jgi:acyl-CoA synthetase (NDP forming)
VTILDLRFDEGPLRYILAPRSVAIIGASERRPSTFRVLSNIRSHRFAGSVYFVNPSRAGEEGFYSSIHQLPEQVDLAVVAVAAARTPAVVEECGRAGVKAIMALAAGFSETGSAGDEGQLQLARTAQRYSMRLLGPNCNGVVNYIDQAIFSTSYLPKEMPKGQQAACFVTQSGWILASTLKLSAMAGASVGIATSVGNEADISACDVIEQLVLDPRVRSVGMYLEQIHSPRQLLDAASAARERGVALTLLRGGRTSRGARAAATHTGALASSGVLLDELLADEGVFFVDSVEDLALMTNAYAIGHHYDGDVAGIMSSGGGKVLLTDALERASLPVAEYSERTVAFLRSKLPAFATIENPLDTTAGFVEDDVYGDLVSILAMEPRVGALALEVPADREVAATRLSQAAKIALEVQCQLVAMWPPPDLDPDVRSQLIASGVVVVPDQRSCMMVLQGLRRSRDRSPRTAAPAALSEPAWVAQARDLMAGVPHGPVTEAVARALVELTGLTSPRRVLADSAASVPDLASTIGFPLFLKVVANGLVHKAEVGAMRWVASERALLMELESLQEAVAAVGISVKGIIVEKAVLPLAEFLIGSKHDPELGPSIVVGAGGRFSEALSDVVVEQPARSRDEAQSLVLRTRYGRAVFKSVGRGIPAQGWNALLDAICAVSEFAAWIGQWGELDVNPVAITDNPAGALALDAAFLRTQ